MKIRKCPKNHFLFLVYYDIVQEKRHIYFDNWKYKRHKEFKKIKLYIEKFNRKI